jgi:hypothetical protein
LDQHRSTQRKIPTAGCIHLVGHDPALWLIFDRASCDRHGASTPFTLCMMLVIQRSEHRDTQARRLSHSQSRLQPSSR